MIQHSLLDEPGSYVGIGSFAELGLRGNPIILKNIDKKDANSIYFETRFSRWKT